MTWLVALPGLSVSVTDCNVLCPIQHAPAIAPVQGRSFSSLVSGMAASLSFASATIADCQMVWPREAQVHEADVPNGPGTRPGRADEALGPTPHWCPWVVR